MPHVGERKRGEQQLLASIQHQPLKFIISERCYICTNFYNTNNEVLGYRVPHSQNDYGRQPCLLPCGHDICWDCSAAIVRTSALDKDFELPVVRNISCPLCRSILIEHKDDRDLYACWQHFSRTGAITAIIHIEKLPLLPLIEPVVDILTPVVANEQIVQSIQIADITVREEEPEPIYVPEVSFSVEAEVEQLLNPAYIANTERIWDPNYCDIELFVRTHSEPVSPVVPVLPVEPVTPVSPRAGWTQDQRQWYVPFTSQAQTTVNWDRSRVSTRTTYADIVSTNSNPTGSEPLAPHRLRF